MGDVTKLPTQGHLLTALDYQMQQDRVARAAYQPGMMMQYLGQDVPAGWIRCNGLVPDPTVHPRLHQVTRGGPLPNDPAWIVKL